MKHLKKTASTILSLIQILAVVAVVGIGVMSFSSRVPMLSKLGLTFYAITSGSMEPAIPTGSLIYAGRYKLEELKAGDVITFKIAGENDAPMAIVTHRIAEVEKIDQTPEESDETKKRFEYHFTTKGDANQEPDQNTLMGGDILGKYAWHIPYLGRVSTFAQTQQGFLLLLILPAVVLIMWELLSVAHYFKDHYAQKSAKEIAELKAELEQHKHHDE